MGEQVMVHGIIECGQLFTEKYGRTRNNEISDHFVHLVTDHGCIRIYIRRIGQENVTN